MATFAHGTPQSYINDYYRSNPWDARGPGAGKPPVAQGSQPGTAQPMQQQSQGTSYNPQGNTPNMSAYGGQQQNMSAYGGGREPQETVGNGWGLLQSRINDGYWGDVTGGGQQPLSGWREQPPPGAGYANDGHSQFFGGQQPPPFQFRGTDFMGNQFNDPTAMTNQQGAMTQALNQQRMGQIGNMFTQGMPMSSLDPFAAYQQGQQMIQGGFQNPFAQPGMGAQPGFGHQLIGQQPGMGQQPGGFNPDPAATARATMGMGQQPMGPPGMGQQPGGQFQDLFQQFGFAPPPGFMDALIQRLGGQQPGFGQPGMGQQPGGGQPPMGQQPGQGFLGRPTGPAQPGGQWRPGDDVPIWGAPGGSYADAVRDRQDPNKVHGGITLQESDRRRDVNRALELSEKMNVGVAESEVSDFLDFYKENNFRIRQQYDPNYGQPRNGFYIPPTPEETARRNQIDQQVHQDLANLWNQQQGRQPLNRSPQPGMGQPGMGQQPGMMDPRSIVGGPGGFPGQQIATGPGQPSQPGFGQPGRAQPTQPPSQGTPYQPGQQAPNDWRMPPRSPYEDYQQQQNNQKAEAQRQGLAFHLLGATPGAPVTDSQILKAMFPSSGGIHQMYGTPHGRGELPKTLQDAGIISAQDARQLASELERYGDNARMQQQSQMGRNAQLHPNHPAYRENMQWAAQDRWNAEHGLMAMLPKRAEYADFLVNQQGMSQADARRMAEQQYPVRSREDEIRGLRSNLQSIQEQLRQEPPPRVGNAAFGITPPVSPLEQQRRELSDQLARLEGRNTEQEGAAYRAQQQQQANRQPPTQTQQIPRTVRAMPDGSFVGVGNSADRADAINTGAGVSFTRDQLNSGGWGGGQGNQPIWVPNDPRKPNGFGKTLYPGQPGYAEAAKRR